MSKDDKTPRGKGKKDAEALAAALRANLMRRKAARAPTDRPAPAGKAVGPDGTR
jgi:hypothetical protein